MKKIVGSILLLLNVAGVFACEVCERNQPKILKGVTHGSGPESKWDYVIIWITVAIVLCTLFLSVKWLIHPGERSAHHIKRFILNNP